jgi:hypothetical protein
VSLWAFDAATPNEADVPLVTNLPLVPSGAPQFSGSATIGTTLYLSCAGSTEGWGAASLQPTVNLAPDGRDRWVGAAFVTLGGSGPPLTPGGGVGRFMSRGRW